MAATVSPARHRIINTAWDRLPTPVQDKEKSLFALTAHARSRDPSPHPHSPPPPSYSSSWSDGLPEIASPVEEDVPTSGGNKTSAFFGSPFASSTPTPPAPPPARANSLLRPQQSYNDIGTGGATSLSRAVSAPTRPKPTNADFHGTRSPVTPPLSIHSASSSSDEPSRPSIVPLSRLFPSRASRDPTQHGDEYGEYDSLSRSSSVSSRGVRRDFMSIPDVFTESFMSRSPSMSSEYKRDAMEPAAATVPSDQTASSPPTMNTLSPPIPRASPLQRRAPHVTREPHAGNDQHRPVPGSVISGDEVSLELIRPLGEGAFSSVWLARDTNNLLDVAHPKLRRVSESLARTERDRSLDGFRPSFSPTSPFKVHGINERLDQMNGFEQSAEGRVVAVKMLDRALCDVNDRTRISFVREVEVLRHIAHPSIVSYLHSFTTSTHHCLVLEHLPGGELFDLINSDERHAKVTEPLLRRMWGELCKAIGWMHGVALVHRDIKLENILLTCDPFTSTPIDLANLHSPLVKITDFGLARFIDPSNPLLTTRCGSEAYAAPEIVTSMKYDGRQTDAWACGVVLYALATRSLPFDKASPAGSGSSHGSVGSPVSRPARETRRAYLMRIAKGEYKWPEPEPEPDSGPTTTDGVDPTRLVTEGVKRVVGRLLVRDPHARARIADLWDDEWMLGEGAPVPPMRSLSPNASNADPGWFPMVEAADVAGLIDGDDLLMSVVQQELL